MVVRDHSERHGHPLRIPLPRKHQIFESSRLRGRSNLMIPRLQILVCRINWYEQRGPTDVPQYPTWISRDWRAKRHLSIDAAISKTSSSRINPKSSFRKRGPFCGGNRLGGNMTHPILSVKFQGPSERRSLNNSGLSVNVLDRLPSHATRDPEREAPAPFLAPVLTGNLTTRVHTRSTC